MVNSVADSNDFLEALDLDSHDLCQKLGKEHKERKKMVFHKKLFKIFHHSVTIWQQIEYKKRTNSEQDPLRTQSVTLTTNTRATGPIEIMRKKPEIMAKDKTPRIQ